MASGRPLLAARAQALPELVTDGRNGFLFRPGDPLDAAQSIARMADFPERLSEMGFASLEKVQIHNRKIVLQCYEEMYKAVIGKEVRAARSRQMSESRAQSPLIEDR